VVKSFYRGFIAEQSNYNVPILCSGLLVCNHDIAVINAGLYHAIAFDMKGKQFCRTINKRTVYGNHPFNVFFRQNG